MIAVRMKMDPPTIRPIRVVTKRNRDQDAQTPQRSPSAPADSRLSDLSFDVLATSVTLGIRRVTSLLAINITSFITADSCDSARF